VADALEWTEFAAASREMAGIYSNPQRVTAKPVAQGWTRQPANVLRDAVLANPRVLRGETLDGVLKLVWRFGDQSSHAGALLTRGYVRVEPDNGGARIVFQMGVGYTWVELALRVCALLLVEITGVAAVGLGLADAAGRIADLRAAAERIVPRAHNQTTD